MSYKSKKKINSPYYLFVKYGWYGWVVFLVLNIKEILKYKAKSSMLLYSIKEEQEYICRGNHIFPITMTLFGSAIYIFFTDAIFNLDLFGQILNKLVIPLLLIALFVNLLLNFLTKKYYLMCNDGCADIIGIKKHPQKK